MSSTSGRALNIHDTWAASFPQEYVGADVLRLLLDLTRDLFVITSDSFRNRAFLVYKDAIEKVNNPLTTSWQFRALSGLTCQRSFSLLAFISREQESQSSLPQTMLFYRRGATRLHMLSWGPSGTSLQIEPPPGPRVNL